METGATKNEKRIMHMTFTALGGMLGFAALGDCIGLTYLGAGIGLVFGGWLAWYNEKRDAKLKYDRN